MQTKIFSLCLSLAALANSAVAEFRPAIPANLFQPNSSYRCDTQQSSGAILSTRSEWKFENWRGDALGLSAPSIATISFQGDIEVGSTFLIEAHDAVIPGYANYATEITGRSQRAEDQIMFNGALGRGFITASIYPAGMQYPVQVTWKSSEGFYTTSYLYCEYSGPHQK